jgi:hypothetical protein
VGHRRSVSQRSGTWEYEGRYYAVTAFSDVATRDGYGWELEDVAPAPGLGTLAEAFVADTTGKFTFRSFTDRPLPFEVMSASSARISRSPSIDLARRFTERPQICTSDPRQIRAFLLPDS